MSGTIEYETRTLSLIVAPAGSEIFSEMATTVEITDESSGEFVQVIQHGHTGLGKIAIEPKEWPALRAAIDRMIEQCRQDNGGEPNGPQI